MAGVAVSGTRAAWRDATAYNSPGTAWRYHVVRDEIFAACSGALLIAETITPGFSVRDETRPAEDIEPGLRCQRRGCRERWP